MEDLVNNPKAGERQIAGFSFKYIPGGQDITDDLGLTQEQGVKLMRNFFEETKANSAVAKLVEALDRGLIHEWDLIFLCAVGLNRIAADMAGKTFI